MTAAVVDPVRIAADGSARIIRLHDARDLARVGGKADTLARLMALGFVVPDGIVVTSATLDEHLQRDGRRERIDSLLEDSHAELAATARHIGAIVTDGGLDTGIREDLFAAAEPLLCRGPVVVRSSAIGEDSAAGSFAGQLDSILHVSSPEALEGAVLRCWSSYWSDRALFYRHARGLALHGMGVIVQQQVDARMAGVLFTDAGDGTMVVEYVRGLADRLVAGEADPERLRIDRQTGAVANTSHQNGAGLAAEGVRDLANIAERLERELGTPQDVEWVIDAAGVVHVVQSRPITAALNHIVDPPAANTSRVAWSNANVTENFPQPISPFLYSIASQGYTNYFRNLARGFGVSRRRINAMAPSLGRIIGVHGARMYYNLSSIHRVLLLVPFGRALASAFDTFVGTRDQDATGATADRIAPSGRIREAAEVVVIAARTTWQYLFLGRRVARFERTVNEFAARTTPRRLATMSIGELRRSLAGFLDIRCNRWNDAALADAAAMVCYATLERLLQIASRFSRSATPSAVLKAIPNVVSAEPAQALWSLSRLIRRNAELRQLFAHETASIILRRVESDREFREFRAAFADYLERWGFRCSAELMLTVPSFQEEPQPVIELLRAYARLENDSPADVQQRQAKERERETARLRAEIVDRTLIDRVPAPLYAWLLGVVLRWTHASIRFRERARLKQALLYSRCRRIALAMGAEFTRLGVLDRRDDVFWLTIGEVEELAAGGAMLPHATRELVALRSRAHAEVAASTPPASFELGEGEYLSLGPRLDDDVSWIERNESLVGTPACGGRVTARATVLSDISEAARLERGDILVTRQTDPGWAPAFFLISGLIVERGGMLSHGAIVAREFGIPCIVGVRDATTRISSGSTITLDGETGRVELV